MSQYKFSDAEKYAVWKHNQERCWLCHRPLALRDCVVDHVLPESLLWNKDKQIEAFTMYNLSKEFNINGFENWLPAHNWCNCKKSDHLMQYSGLMQGCIETLIKRAPVVKRMAERLASGKAKSFVLGKLSACMESGEITTEDLKSLLLRYGFTLEKASLDDGIILLSGRKWVHINEVRREGLCECERMTCVDSKEKVYCYFGPELSDWVVGTGLYYKCYDEVVECPRCGEPHKRGHIGKDKFCGRPFADQATRSD